MASRREWILGCAVCLGLNQALANSPADCTLIISNMERLACFDRAARTPAVVPPTRVRQANGPSTPSQAMVMANEALRGPDELGFRISVGAERAEGGQQRIVISAPAMGAPPQPYLAISCVQNISRLQLLTLAPVPRNRVQVQLSASEQPLPGRPWQVLEDGHVVDAGRGLVAIEAIKVLRAAQRIHVSSDYPALDGLVFDAQGLAPMIDQARKACRW